MLKINLSTPHTSRRERGFALVTALVLMAIGVTAVAVGAPAGLAALRRTAAALTRSDEKWVARERAATGLDYYNERLRDAYAADLNAGRVRLGGRVLPAFDDQTQPADQSRAVIVATEDGASEPSGCESTTQYCTSVLGNVEAYVGARRGLIDAAFFDEADIPAGTVGIADIRVAERRVMARGGEAAYRVEYVLDARGGEHGRTRDRGEVVLGVNDVSCGTSVRTPAAEQTIISGQAATIQADYTRAKTLVLSANGSEIERRSVVDDLAVQSAAFAVAPVADTTYTIDAAGTGACAAQTTHTVRVAAPVCPVFQLFEVTPATLYGAGDVTVSWQVADAFEVRLNGSPVSASGSMTVAVNSDTTFTLEARDITGQCPQAQTRTVRVLPCPALVLFEADRTNIERGGPPVNLRWQVDNVAPGTRVLLNGVEVAASGVMSVTPDVTTDYTLLVEPAAGAGCAAQQRAVRVNVADRTCPEIVMLEASPPSVTDGEVVTVRWRVTNFDPATTTIRLTGGGLNELVAPEDSRTLTLPVGSHVFRLEVTSTLPECPPPTSREAGVTVSPRLPPDPACDIVIQSFDLGASCVAAGAAVTPTWRVTSSIAGTRVQINGAGDYPLAGSAAFTVNSPQTFTLSADAPTCAAQTAARFVDVAQPAPVITMLTAAPGTQPAQGAPVTITYAATGAQSATINGSALDPAGNPVNPAGGSFTVTASGPLDYTLAATSGGCSPRSVSQTIQIRPTACPVPVVQFFRAVPPSVAAGGRTNFEWAIANAEPGASVSITGPGVSLSGLPATGSAAAFMPAATGTHFFTLTVTNPCAPGNTVSQQTAVDVTCPAPRVTSFSVNPASYTAGSRAFITFSWTTNDPTGSPVTVSIDGGVGGGLPANGSVDAPAPGGAGTHTYTLRAANACGASATAQVTVRVTTGHTPSSPTCAQQLDGAINGIFLHQTFILTKTVNFSWGGVPLTATIDEVVVRSPALVFPAVADTFSTCYQVTIDTPDPARVGLNYVKMPGPFVPPLDDPGYSDGAPFVAGSLIDIAATGTSFGTYRTAAVFNAGGTGFGLIGPDSSIFAIRGEADGRPYATMIPLDYYSMTQFMPPPPDALIQGEYYGNGGVGNGLGPLTARIVNGQMVAP